MEVELDRIELMRDASEVVRYERDNVRLYIRQSRLSRYPDLRAPCHWHDDIEWIHILDGTMSYYIDGERLTLGRGDTLFVNARRMHYGYGRRGDDCRFICVLFHPSLLTGSEALLKSDVRPVLEHPGVGWRHLTASGAAGQAAAGILSRMMTLKEDAPKAYELEAVGLLHILWSVLRRDLEPLPPVEGAPHTELDLQRAMVAFICGHYGEKLTLEEIAASGHVSRSRCCQMFQRHLQQTPIQYLNAYRLKTAANLLRSTEDSVTDIALSCGFHHLSYFAQLFQRAYGCTPKAYRTPRRSKTEALCTPQSRPEDA